MRLPWIIASLVIMGECLGSLGKMKLTISVIAEELRVNDR
jgi:hypothetical protein